MAPNCGDKSDLYRTKLSLFGTENLPSVATARQRRSIHSVRRRRLRGSVALRGSARVSSNANTARSQHQGPSATVNVRHPMVSDDRWRRTLRKRRRQRVVQMKLDGNVLTQQTRPIRPLSDHTYNEIKQTNLTNSRVPPTANGAAAGGVLERAMQFNGALRDRVFSWYRGANYATRDSVPPSQPPTSPITPQVCSTSENADVEQKVSTSYDLIRCERLIRASCRMSPPMMTTTTTTTKMTSVAAKEEKTTTMTKSSSRMRPSKIFSSDAVRNPRRQRRSVARARSSPKWSPVLTVLLLEQFRSPSHTSSHRRRLHRSRRVHHRCVDFPVSLSASTRPTWTSSTTFSSVRAANIASGTASRP